MEVFKIKESIKTWLKELFKNVNKEYINSSLNFCGAFNSKVFCIPKEILSQLVKNYGSDSVVNRCTTYFLNGDLEVGLVKYREDSVVSRNIKLGNKINYCRFELKVEYNNFLLFEHIFLNELEKKFIPLLLKDINSKVVDKITECLHNYKVLIVPYHDPYNEYKKYEFLVKKIPDLLNKEKGNIMLMHPKTKEHLSKFVDVSNYVFYLSENMEKDVVICGPFEKFILKFGDLKFSFVEENNILKEVFVPYALNFDFKPKTVSGYIKSTELTANDWKEDSRLSFVWFGKDLFNSSKDFNGFLKLYDESPYHIKKGCLKNLSRMCSDRTIESSDILKKCRTSYDPSDNKENKRLFTIPISDLQIDSLVELSNEPFLEKFITTLVGPFFQIVDQLIMESILNKSNNVISINEEENIKNFMDSFLNKIKDDGTFVGGLSFFEYIGLFMLTYPGSFVLRKNNNKCRFKPGADLKLFSRDLLLLSNISKDVAFYGNLNLIKVNLKIEIVDIVKTDIGAVVKLKVCYDLDILDGEKFVVFKFKNSRECAWNFLFINYFLFLLIFWLYCYWN